ncbi:conserved hypothetical protein [Vibrio owensii]|nr:conserved hypothetical protein [Vibrio owensii]CAH1559949.1 conserved hypothetical protein [Vibrio owensii]
MNKHPPICPPYKEEGVGRRGRKLANLVIQIATQQPITLFLVIRITANFEKG